MHPWDHSPTPPTPKPADWTTYTGTMLEDHAIVVYEWLRWVDAVGEYATRRLAALDRLERALQQLTGDRNA